MVFKVVFIVFFIQLLTCILYCLWGIAEELNVYYCVKYGNDWRAKEIEQQDVEMGTRVFTKSFLPMLNSLLKLIVITDLIIAIILKLVF